MRFMSCHYHFHEFDNIKLIHMMESNHLFDLIARQIEKLEQFDIIKRVIIYLVNEAIYIDYFILYYNAYVQSLDSPTNLLK